MEIRRQVGAVVALFGLVAVSCGSDSDGSDGDGSPAGTGDGGAGQPIAIRIEDDPGSLDPHTTQSAIGREVAFFMYDTLVHMEEGEIVSGLAESWEATPNSVQLVLRDDVTCDDGTELLASHVKANLDRVADPETASPFVEVFLGSTDYEVTADDDTRTVTVEVPEAYGDLLPGLSTFPHIICPAGLEDPEQLESGSSGTGPFTLADLVPNDRYTLEAREDYRWGPGGEATDDDRFPGQVTLRVVESDATAANLLLTGELDLTSTRGSERSRLESESGLVEHVVPRATAQIIFNQEQGRATADEEVRLALAQAIDRQSLAEIVLGGTAELAPSVLLPTAVCFDESLGDDLPDYDSDAAGDVLDGEGVSLRLLAAGQSGEEPAAEFIAEEWGGLGVDVTIDSPDPDTRTEILLGGGDWDVVILAQNGTVLPGLVRPFFSGPPVPDGRNIGHFSNADYDRLSAQARGLTGDEACEQWNTAEAALHEHSDVLPLYYATRAMYGSGIEFRLGLLQGNAIAPTSLRSG
jgi:peptide/nickel transport system substrate-binding protein